MRRKGETFRKGTPLVLAPAIDEHRTRLRIWTDAGKVVVFDPSMTVFGRLFSGEAQDAVEYCNPEVADLVTRIIGIMDHSHDTSFVQNSPLAPFNAVVLSRIRAISHSTSAALKLYHQSWDDTYHAPYTGEIATYIAAYLERDVLRAYTDFEYQLIGIAIGASPEVTLSPPRDSRHVQDGEEVTVESADLNAVGVLQLREWCKQALRYMATPAVPEEGLLKECILTVLDHFDIPFTPAFPAQGIFTSFQSLHLSQAQITASQGGLQPPAFVRMSAQNNACDDEPFPSADSGRNASHDYGVSPLTKSRPSYASVTASTPELSPSHSSVRTTPAESPVQTPGHALIFKSANPDDAAAQDNRSGSTTRQASEQLLKAQSNKVSSWKYVQYVSGRGVEQGTGSSAVPFADIDVTLHLWGGIGLAPLHSSSRYLRAPHGPALNTERSRSAFPPLDPDASYEHRGRELANSRPDLVATPPPVKEKNDFKRTKEEGSELDDHYHEPRERRRRGSA